jgi:hypothetical protein
MIFNDVSQNGSWVNGRIDSSSRAIVIPLYFSAF